MTLVAEESQSDTRAPSHWRAWVPGVVAVLLGISWIALLICSGSPAIDVLRWSGAVLIGALLPGFVVVRVSRTAVTSLIEDVAWAAAAGCLVGMLGWFLDRVLPWSPGAYALGAVVMGIGVAIPSARRRVLTAPAPGWGTLPSLALAAIVLVSYAWMYFPGLRTYPANPGARGIVYPQDAIYQLSLLGELRRTPSPTYPQVAGTPMHYHWFVHAIDAHLLEHTGIDPWDATLRLAPATLVPAVLVLAAVIARRMSGWVWAGPLAAFLLGVIDLSETTRPAVASSTIGVVQEYWMVSETQTLGWLAGLAAAGCMFAFVRRSEVDAAIPVALFLPMLILAAGAKSAEIPVLLAGIGLAVVVQIVRRDGVAFRRCALALLCTVAVFAGSALTIYGFNSYGLRFQLWGFAYATAAQLFPAKVVHHGALHMSPPTAPLAVLVIAVLWVVLPHLPRLLGMFFQLRYRAWDATGWICLGTALAGLAAPFVFRHPGASQIYFLQSAYPIGVVGAASGLVLVGHRLYRGLGLTRLWRLGSWFGGLLAVGALAAAIVAYSQPRLNPIQQWAQDHPSDPMAARASGRWLAWHWLAPTITLTAAIGALVGGVWLVAWLRYGHRDGHLRTIIAALVTLSAMCLLLGTGLFGLILHFVRIAPTPSQGASTSERATAQATTGPLATMPDQLAAGRYVDMQAGKNDIVATNIYCMTGLRKGRPPTTPCDARGFSAAAFTQRRTLVAGWAYSDRVTNAAWNTRSFFALEPFWNSTLLDAELAACDHPTAALLAHLYRDDGVRWVFVDLRQSPVDVAALDHLALRRFLGPTAEVWQLKRPAA